MSRIPMPIHKYSRGEYFYFILLKKERMIYKMKKTLSLILAFVCVFALAACGNTVDKAGLWENATYLKDMEFGKGATAVVVEIKAGDQSVTFTVNTDQTTVGAALLEHGLIAGDEGEFGLYVKVVNGITADYDVDQSYWAFYINGEYAMTGVDQTYIDTSATYLLEYTK